MLAALEALRQEVLGRCSTTIVNIDQSISDSSVALAHGASITDIDQSAPFAHSSIGYGSTVNAAASITYGATATTLNANPSTALAPPASSSSSYSTEPASAEAIAAIHRKLDAVLEQVGGAAWTHITHPPLDHR